jgi:hypothetical protein
MRFLVGMGAFLLMGGQVFALTGTVKDSQGAAIAGAKVSLKSDTSVHVNTSVSGAFTINPAVSVFDRGFSSAQTQKIKGASIVGNQLRLTLSTSVRVGSLALFAADGSRKADISLGSRAVGDQRIDLPQLAPGLYFMRLLLDDFSGEAQLIHTGHAYSWVSKAAQSGDAQNGASAVLARRSATAAAIDTLVTEKAGYTTVKTPIDSYSQTDVAIVLNASSSLPPITNYSATGPYEVINETGTGPDGSYTIYRPKTLGANGFLHAPITFGPGTGMQVSQLSNLIQRIASHGFVVIGRQLTGGPRDAVTRQRLIAGLDWIIAQNTVAGSAYQGKIAVNKGVAMGYSVGATGSIEIGGHAAIATVVAIHGHEAQGTTRGPILMIGGTNDVTGGQSWLAPSYAASQTQTFFSLLTGADHGYIQTTVNGVQGGLETPAIIAWIRYWIYNDQGAKSYFYGDDCIMCKSPWANTQRKNWQ